MSGTTRRDLLAGAGLALAGSLLPGGSSEEPGGLATGKALSIVLRDSRLPLPADMQRLLASTQARMLMLEADPVRMWRGEHAALLAAPSTRLMGVTSWPNFLMVRGLAEESGRRVRQQRVAAHGSIVWLIA